MPICYGNLCYQYQVCSLLCIRNWIRYRGSLFPHFRSPRAWILYHLCIASPPRPISPPRYWRDSRGAWSNCGTRTRYVSLSLTWWQRRQPLCVELLWGAQGSLAPLLPGYRPRLQPNQLQCCRHTRFILAIWTTLIDSYRLP